jgi:hypothetical protein
MKKRKKKENGKERKRKPILGIIHRSKGAAGQLRICTNFSQVIQEVFFT